MFDYTISGWKLATAFKQLRNVRNKIVQNATAMIHSLLKCFSLSVRSQNVMFIETNVFLCIKTNFSNKLIKQAFISWGRSLCLLDSSSCNFHWIVIFMIYFSVSLIVNMNVQWMISFNCSYLKRKSFTGECPALPFDRHEFADVIERLAASGKVSWWFYGRCYWDV